MFYKSLIISNISTLYVIGRTWYNMSQKYRKMESVKQFPFLKKFQIPVILLKSKKRFPHLYFVVAKGLVCDYDTIYQCSFYSFFIFHFSSFIPPHKKCCYCLCTFKNIALAGNLIYPAPLFWQVKKKSDPQLLIAFCKIWY